MPKRTDAPAQQETKRNLGMFHTEEEQDSWYRWLSMADDTLRIICLPDERNVERLRFMHRIDGPDPIDEPLLDAKINRMFAKKAQLMELLGQKPGESYQAVYHRWYRRSKISKAAITMANLGIIKHWEPPADNFMKQKNYPRKKVDETSMKERERSMADFVASMVP
jgi:hypothetical protein